MTDFLGERLKNVIGSAPAKKQRAFGFYWTRKSAELAASLIDEFSSDTGVVLDPFLGSGSSALGFANLADKRLFIGVELNEMPIRNLAISLGDLSGVVLEDFERLEKLLEKIRELYVYESEQGSVTVYRTIHEYVDEKLVPVAFRVALNGKKLEVSSESSTELFQQLLSAYQNRVAQLPQRQSLELTANSRIAVREGMKVADVFGPMGFESLSKLRLSSNESLLFNLVISASLHLVRLTDSKSQSQFPFWHPKQQIHEQSAFDVLKKSSSQLKDLVSNVSGSLELRFIEEIGDLDSRTEKSVFLIQGDTSIAMRNAIPDSCVDLVITDPPYFDQVAYSEYLKLWEFFTGFKSNLDDEIVESSRVNGEKTRSRYLEGLSAAFIEIRRTMKEGGLALVYFKDSKPHNLHDFIYTLEKVGLRYVTQVHLPKPTFTYKQNASKENTVGGDAIMVFNADQPVIQELPERISKDVLEELFIASLGRYIDKYGPSSLTEALDNEIIKLLYPTGYLKTLKSPGHFSELASREFEYDAESRKWRRK